MSNPKKPPQLKVISGTTRKDRDEGASMAFPNMGSVPDPPSWLCAEAVNEFNNLASMLFKNGLLTEGSTSSLAHLAALHAELTKHWRAGACPSGHLVSQYRALAGDFGLTPISRSRITTATQPAKTNKFANNGKRT